MKEKKKLVYVSIPVTYALPFGSSSRESARDFLNKSRKHPDVSDHHHHYHPQHHQDVSVASSYMHFHGPVEGPEFEVKVPYVIAHHTEHNHLIGNHEDHEQDEHITHGYTLDYVAHPKYEFSYGVEDHHTGDFHGQKEVRDGDGVTGEYTVKEPGGGIRVVSYRADKDGFHAVVHTSGKNDHSGATYSAHAQGQAQGHNFESAHEDIGDRYSHDYSQENYP
ncbi:hypothetical protein PV326_007650 [Microctonus aethiopoides]|nr:hypothetical protein PV326_007650 [Microctonus aethiopoides]